MTTLPLSLACATEEGVLDSLTRLLREKKICPHDARGLFVAYRLETRNPDYYASYQLKTKWTGAQRDDAKA